VEAGVNLAQSPSLDVGEERHLRRMGRLLDAAGATGARALLQCRNSL
jgi:hypothetical protein